MRSQLIRQLEDEIDKLRRERDEQAALVAQMREQVADYDALIERLTEGFAKLKAGHELQQRGEWDEVKKYSPRPGVNERGPESWLRLAGGPAREPARSEASYFSGLISEFGPELVSQGPK